MKSTTHSLAFVLGSGGVRSVAALGITQRLAEEGIRPGLIAGCSSGALFGATIAMGLDAQEALRLATRLWSQELTQQRRWRAYAQMILPRLAGFGDSFAMRDDALIARRIADALATCGWSSCPRRCAWPPRTPSVATRWCSGAGAWRMRCVPAWRYPSSFPVWKSMASDW